MGGMEMIDKDKLQIVINHMSDSATIEDIISAYLREYSKDFSVTRLKDLVNLINLRYLYPKIEELSHLRSVTKERATYIKTYLEGKMWKDEESARKNLQPQIDNAQTIIDLCE